MMRLLILILAIVLLAFTLRALFHRPTIKRNGPKNKIGEKMVPCAVCNLHLPTSEAFHEGDLSFCSREHRQQWLDSRTVDDK